MDKNDLKQVTEEMRARMRPELFKHPEKYIPRGKYCYHMPGDDFYEKIKAEKWKNVPIEEIPKHRDFYRDFYDLHGMPFDPCPFWVQMESRLAFCHYLDVSDYDTGSTPLCEKVKVCKVNCDGPGGASANRKDRWKK